jgi:NAD-dependent deacetylase sirtuin 4
MYIQEFMSSSDARKRYWARNFVGWSAFSAARPNEAHRTVRDWEVEGKVKVLVTQNVDRLHHKAGSISAIELHGTGYEVICLQCKDFREDRHEFQKVLLENNPDFLVEGTGNEVRPDGDVDLDPDQVHQFIIPPCPHCGGILKPDIVFFGDNVPKARVEKIYDGLSNCDSLLVLGSSLQVFSSYRFILRAKEQGIPIGIVTLGPTRGDHLASFKLTSRVGEILSLVS